jgi:type I restriction enzyme M protein
MDNNKETERAELHKTIWRIANDLRGSVDGWDFKTYVLSQCAGAQGGQSGF